MGTVFDITLLMATLRSAAPLVLAALGGIYAERSGVVNIALEGKMLTGAFAAVVVAYYTGNPWLGVLAAILTGGVMAYIFAVVSIKYRANQVVSGVAINMLAAGLTVFMMRVFFGTAGTSPAVTRLPAIGPFTPLVYLAPLLVAVTFVVLYRTPWGLWIRAVGEHPKAAATVGINVIGVRYACVVLSGMLAGVAGAHLSIGTLSVFVRDMTAGRGFIALAAMIFGKWHPLGALAASLLFGFSEALQMRLQGGGIPSQLIQAVPYVFTMIVLAGFVGRATAPAALGEPFRKE
ncbi:MAG: ABC transporter permease [Firmicutes bacterium]|nr:ABC transporter permease [Dethiobacter sp.]MBS3889638.1 ABC transporter permease [Bacillota bacterium]MBS4054624.1 ABC transporter permease [Thermaerobacter sp.]